MQTNIPELIPSIISLLGLTYQTTILQGQKLEKQSQPLYLRALKLFKLANSKAVYPTSPVLPWETTMKPLANTFSSLLLHLTGPGASGVASCAVGMFSPLRNSNRLSFLGPSSNLLNSPY